MITKIKLVVSWFLRKLSCRCCSKAPDQGRPKSQHKSALGLSTDSTNKQQSNTNDLRCRSATPEDQSCHLTKDKKSTNENALKDTSKLNVLTINVCGIECNGRIEQIRLLLVKYEVSIAILSETETTHSFAATTNMEGFKAFVPPSCVTGPPGKEVGVIILISEALASSAKLRPDINDRDSVQTLWIELLNYKFIIGGVYRRHRKADPELEKNECSQLNNYILKATQTGKSVLLLGDTNMDHSNPDHKKKNEARELLCFVEAANMRTGPIWKSFGLHKVCKCDIACGCPKQQRVSTIDNVYLSLCETANASVLLDAISDHSPILVNLQFQKMFLKLV